MACRLFALVAGLFYTILGILGMFPKFLWDPELPRLGMQGVHFHPGWLGGFIVVNLPHNILWIILGVVGVVAFASYGSSKNYARGLFVAASAMAIIGFLPLGIASLWGFLPLFGWNILIHAFTAILAWYYGFVYTYAREMGIAQ